MRPNKEEYNMAIARVVSKRSTCLRRFVGAIAVLDNRILATGYNGAPAGISHCNKDNCLRAKFSVMSGERHELCRGVHAEQNVLIQAAKYGISIKGATLYCTNFPCSVCAKMIINAGIREIVYAEDYNDTLAKELFAEAGIITRKIYEKETA